MVNKIKLLIYLAILTGLTSAAEEIKIDSLNPVRNFEGELNSNKYLDSYGVDHDGIEDISAQSSRFSKGVKNNPLKRQKLFFAAEQNWIPPTLLPDDPTCLCAGCCLIPLTGCLMTGQKIWAKKDTTPQDTIALKRRKWDLGIGYAIGVCFTDGPLRKNTGGDWVFDPVEVFGAHLHWLNLVNINISRPLNKDWLVETGIEYGWIKLVKRRGLGPVKVSNVKDSIDGSLATSSIWTLEKVSLFIIVNRNGLSFGTEITYADASTKEGLWAPTLIEEKEVIRNCVGGGILFSLKINNKRNKKIRIVPFVGGRLSVASEYKNNSPWKMYWEERLNVSFSGVYAGLQFIWGGVK